MLHFLFPHKRSSLAPLKDLAAASVRAAGLLEAGFTDPTRFPELAGAIKAIGTEADSMTAAMHAQIGRVFILPIDREEVQRLAARLKRIVDIAAGTAGRGGALPLGTAKEPARRLASVFVAATGEIQAAVAALDASSQVLEHTRIIKGHEETGDQIWEDGISALFAGQPDPIEVLVWKEMYDLLEEGLDACDDVANLLETISVQRG